MKNIKSDLMIAAAVAALICVGMVLITMCITPQAQTVSATPDTPYNWYFKQTVKGEQPVVCDNVDFLDKYDLIYMGNANDKKIYLTFDMGYENGNTEKILDALKKHNAKGAFFVTGHYLDTNPDIIKRMVSEGHLVCNHTDKHADLTQISDKEKFSQQVEGLAQRFYELTGSEMPKYLRPPEGKYSERELKMSEELGYTNVFWSFAYKDWLNDAQPSREEAMEKIISCTHNGMVALLHATSATNGEIMDELLTKWEKMGYEIYPISDLKT